MTLKRIREVYEMGEEVLWPEDYLREGEQELRGIVAESMYAMGYAMGSVGRVLDVLKAEQRYERAARRKGQR